MEHIQNTRLLLLPRQLRPIRLLPTPKKKKRIEAAQQRDAIKKATKHLSERVKQLETKTTELELKQAQIDEELASPDTYKNSARVKELNITKAALQKELDEVMESWMMAQEALDEAMKAFE